MKAHVTKPEDLTSVPKTHKVEGEKQHLQVVMTSSEREAGMVVYTCNPNIYKMEKGLKFEASLGNN